MAADGVGGAAAFVAGENPGQRRGDRLASSRCVTRATKCVAQVTRRRRARRRARAAVSRWRQGLALTGHGEEYRDVSGLPCPASARGWR